MGEHARHALDFLRGDQKLECETDYSKGALTTGRVIIEGRSLS
jgi:hypothetical protein